MLFKYCAVIRNLPNFKYLLNLRVLKKKIFVFKTLVYTFKCLKKLKPSSENIKELKKMEANMVNTFHRSGAPILLAHVEKNLRGFAIK